MIYDVDKFTDYLVKMQLTATQFYICWLLERNDIKNLEKYLNGVGHFDKKDFEYLMDRGYLISTNPNSKEFNAIELVVTLEFKEMVIDTNQAWDELLDMYPKHVVVNNNKVPSTGLTLQDAVLARQLYEQEIKKDKFKHVAILGLIKKWKDTTVGESAPFKVDKFITSKYWKELSNLDEGKIKPKTI